MIKKLFVIILALCIVSCYRIDKFPVYLKKDFNSEVNLGDTTYYYMKASIDTSARLWFIKKITTHSKQYIYMYGNSIYDIPEDTIICLVESHCYSRNRLKAILQNKNTEDRDTTIMKFTPNMYIQWNTFDEMFEFVK